MLPENQDFGDVTELLRKVESAAKATRGDLSREVATYGNNAKPPDPTTRGPTGATVLLLIANTAMVTAAITAVVFYLLHAGSNPLDERMTDRSAPAPAASVRELARSPSESDQAAAPPSFAPSPRIGMTEGRLDRTAGQSAPDAADPPNQVHETAADGPPQPSIVLPNELHVTVSGKVRVPIALEPPEATRLVAALTLRGLPATVTPTAGSVSQGGIWIVPAEELSQLELVAASDAAVGRSDIHVSARSEDGRKLSSSHTTLVIATPGSETAVPDAPTQNLAVTPLDAQAQAQLIATGEGLLQNGQIGAARMVFERAVNGGSADAGIMLGDTFDPVRLQQWGVQGLTGDLEKATYWYERADEMGAPDAKGRIVELGAR